MFWIALSKHLPAVTLQVLADILRFLIFAARTLQVDRYVLVCDLNNVPGYLNCKIDFRDPLTNCNRVNNNKIGMYKFLRRTKNWDNIFSLFVACLFDSELNFLNLPDYFVMSISLSVCISFYDEAIKIGIKLIKCERICVFYKQLLNRSLLRK